MMNVGISLPQLGPQAGPENLVRAAKRAEELGYDSVWVLERLLWPLNPREPYPPAPDGKLPVAYQNVLDPLETLTFVAAHTTKIRLGTSVIVLPYHTPIQLAKRIATLDVLSNGRVEFGVGVGWSRDEFEAAGTSFEHRGARADEFLHALIKIWTQDSVAFDGQFYRIAESRIGPKPVQKPHPPIHVAGYGTYALERAVQFGSGWNPAGIPSLEWLKQMIAQLGEIARRRGRPSPRILLRTFTTVLDNSVGAQRSPMTGTLEEIKHDIGLLRDIGVTDLIHSPSDIGFSDSPQIDQGIARMEQLIEISR